MSVLILILIHDIHPMDIDTQGKDKSVPVSTESQTTDQSDGCNASCPCVIHVLEESLVFLQYQIENLTANSSIRITICPMPERIILESIYRPPES